MQRIHNCNLCIHTQGLDTRDRIEGEWSQNQVHDQRERAVQIMEEKRRRLEEEFKAPADGPGQSRELRDQISRHVHCQVKG